MNIEQQKELLDSFIEEIHTYKGVVDLAWEWEVKEDGEVWGFLKIPTRTSFYHVSATLKEDHTKSYLGCIMNARHPETGGRDFPDGGLTRENWSRIKDSIIWNEMSRSEPRDHIMRPRALKKGVIRTP